MDDSSKDGYVLDHETPGEEIERRRQSLGMSLQALAKEVPVSRDWLSKIEKGQRDSPRIVARARAVLTQFEEEFGVTDADYVTVTVELPWRGQSTRAVFRGSSTGVSDAVADLLRKFDKEAP